MIIIDDLKDELEGGDSDTRTPVLDNEGDFNGTLRIMQLGLGKMNLLGQFLDLNLEDKGCLEV